MRHQFMLVMAAFLLTAVLPPISFRAASPVRLFALHPP
jgi:hypothetical protein